ncbi:protein LITTLE ZIPPER 2 [Vigna radiata var. radiata]|uniref:Protein LITTLE ZIPPER 2 n=1 Tax=Vigna radiata var. radiata TaxID=3916 RepID=A0A1S3T935_VIGRR|nr:protein LITTLE ZIPPER 2 [Vigna radiata var. radiata]
MCSFSSKQTLCGPLLLALPRPWPSKRHKRHLRLGLLQRRRAHLKEARQRKRMVVVKAEIQMKNLKLYMENQTIIEENEKLRKQAMLLHKENQALLSQLQKKLSEQTNNTNNN